MNSAILQSYWNFSDGLFNYIQAGIFSQLKLLFNFYVKRTVRRQHFGAKFNLTYHNGAPVLDILRHYFPMLPFSRLIRFDVPSTLVPGDAELLP